MSDYYGDYDSDYVDDSPALRCEHCGGGQFNHHPAEPAVGIMSAYLECDHCGGAPERL